MAKAERISETPAAGLSIAEILALVQAGKSVWNAVQAIIDQLKRRSEPMGYSGPPLGDTGWPAPPANGKVYAVAIDGVKGWTAD